MQTSERFLRYAKINTESSSASASSPSTACQFDLAKLLCEELTALGIQAQMDEYGYVYASIPATKGYENAPALGFVAHMDTAQDFSGENVCPIIHENYDGKDIVLPKENRVISVSDFPELKELVGKTIITADGSTLLGGDDKAGIANVVTACEEILQSGLPHGKLCIGFTPDEEIGRGTDHFDVERFGATVAYTADGGKVDTIHYENFNAASAAIDIEGVSVHPGGAKDIMENACLLAMEINALLPANETPAHTDEYEGFYHVTELKGSSAHATMHYIIRDHDTEKFAARKATMEQVVAAVQTNHPQAKIKLTLADSYYNMAQQILPHKYLIDNAVAALAQEGLEAVFRPIRGGTDGARLSFMGLPCPNIGTGGYNCHGPFEFVVVEQMESAVRIIKNLVALYAAQK